MMDPTLSDRGQNQTASNILEIFGAGSDAKETLHHMQKRGGLKYKKRKQTEDPPFRSYTLYIMSKKSYQAQLSSPSEQIKHL